MPSAIPKRISGDLPSRRTVRLTDYDYSRAGWYFVTIATYERRPLLGRVTTDAQVALSPLGQIVQQCWHELACRYEQLHADCWVIMPDHVHLLLGLLPATATIPAKALGQLVGAFKAACTRLGRPYLQEELSSLWQRNYYEHIIRTATELENYRHYVRDNPRRWVEKRELLRAS